MNLIDLCESGRIPDPLIRWGVRRISRGKLREEYSLPEVQRRSRREQRIKEWSSGPIAVQTGAANEQHYEVPAEFFHSVLGSELKYSCCLFDGDCDSLDAAEQAMLELYARRAGLENGQDVLDLGCGWGSFAVWAARRYPESRITAISNSSVQRGVIEERARHAGLSNLSVVTCDINDFAPDLRFDRIVSVEMMEHARNHRELFRRASRWLRDDGRMFVHVFCHRELTYAYEDENKDDWMARHFFTGGMMPSFDLFQDYQEHLRVLERWWVDGSHYEKTSNAWLAKLDAQRDALLALFARDLPGDQAARQLQRWRMFFLAVAEFFGLEHGQQWGVGHFLFERQPKTSEVTGAGA